MSLVCPSFANVNTLVTCTLITENLVISAPQNVTINSGNGEIKIFQVTSNSSQTVYLTYTTSGLFTLNAILSNLNMTVNPVIKIG